MYDQSGLVKIAQTSRYYTYILHMCVRCLRVRRDDKRLSHLYKVIQHFIYYGNVISVCYWCVCRIKMSDDKFSSTGIRINKMLSKSVATVFTIESFGFFFCCFCIVLEYFYISLQHTIGYLSMLYIHTLESI